ncbi:Nif3-like dinuclear metal center hexameric protein [Lactobacillus sp. DCY120]|uniref:GTP cyclohydrolase 1 type 2 homolog n=2 Tax=Bombilactobacillus apium TaxID=2675299 RepID=A0A850QYR4_9LACO|nr:Nif3-like dinuclear metal center hexameric protein [Bombilactobacillus apium]
MIIERIEKLAPLAIKIAHDPTGLQLGNPDLPVHKVLTTLDVRPEVVQEAIDQQVDLIVAHHPVMFHPATNLDTRDPQNQMYAQLLQHQITVYAAHTNVDKATGGMNDWLAQKLGLQEIQTWGTDQDGIPLGRWGLLPSALSVQELARLVRQKFQLSGLRLISKQPEQIVRKIGFLGGDGGKFYPQAVARGLEVLITGDVYYHTAHEMLTTNLSVIDPGHHIEVIFQDQMQSLIKSWAQAADWQIEVQVAQANTEPFQFIF